VNMPSCNFETVAEIINDFAPGNRKAADSIESVVVALIYECLRSSYAVLRIFTKELVLLSPENIWN
jgi:hypothetical protein